jgi:hypothetical protein
MWLPQHVDVTACGCHSMWMSQHMADTCGCHSLWMSQHVDVTTCGYHNMWLPRQRKKMAYKSGGNGGDPGRPTTVRSTMTTGKFRLVLCVSKVQLFYTQITEQTGGGEERGEGCHPSGLLCWLTVIWSGAPH